MLIATMLPICSMLAAAYLNTFLRVAAGQSVKSAARIGSISNSTATIVACAAGLVTRYLRRLKWVILFGAAIEVLGMGASPLLPRLCSSACLR